MILVPPHAFTLEQIREPKTRHDLTFWYEIVAVFGLIDDEFADLFRGRWLVGSSIIAQQRMGERSQIMKEAPFTSDTT